MNQDTATLSIYALLNAEAKQWWYHAHLRDNGRPNDARRLERASVRRMVSALRETCAHNGYLLILDQESASDPRWMLVIARYHWWSGYCARTSLFVQAIRLCGIEVFNYTQLNAELEEQLWSRLQRKTNCNVVLANERQ